MKVTNAQLQFIDNYLKKNGVKYWDIRLEMVDHLVSNIEDYKGAADFDTLFKSSLANAGWDKNLDAIHTQSWKRTNIIYRTLLWKEILKLLQHPEYIMAFIGLYFGLTYIANTDKFWFNMVVGILFFTPMMVLTFENIKAWIKKLGRSVNLQYGTCYFAFGAIMVNTPIQFIPKDNRITCMPLILCLYLLVSFAGYRVYKQALKKVLILKGF